MYAYSYITGTSSVCLKRQTVLKYKKNCKNFFNIFIFIIFALHHED